MMPINLVKFFTNRYGHRAVFLETIRGVPGMLMHFKSLRQSNDEERIRELLDKTKNECM